ncbi:MAG TPA: hypothetical protein VGP15_12345 [Burkholderiales bacterium]|nr:hypothetical protein [Burkholderiales bacterium]
MNLLAGVVAMAASPKKRAKPRPRGAAKKRAPNRPDLSALDGEWRTFITKAAGSEPVPPEWPDPKGAPSTQSAIRKAVKKKPHAKKKSPAAKTPRKAAKAKKAKKK